MYIKEKLRIWLKIIKFIWFLGKYLKKELLFQKEGLSLNWPQKMSKKKKDSKSQLIFHASSKVSGFGDKSGTKLRRCLYNQIITFRVIKQSYSTVLFFYFFIFFFPFLLLSEDFDWSNKPKLQILYSGSAKQDPIHMKKLLYVSFSFTLYHHLPFFSFV